MSHQKSLELVSKGSKVHIKVKPAFSKYNVRRNRNFLQLGGYVFWGIFKHLCLKIAVHREEDFST